MADREILDAHAGSDLIVHDAVENYGGDRQQDDFERFHNSLTNPLRGRFSPFELDVIGLYFQFRFG